MVVYRYTGRGYEHTTTITTTTTVVRNFGLCQQLHWNSHNIDIVQVDSNLILFHRGMLMNNLIIHCYVDSIIAILLWFTSFTYIFIHWISDYWYEKPAVVELKPRWGQGLFLVLDCLDTACVETAGSSKLGSDHSHSSVHPGSRLEESRYTTIT